MVLLSIWSTKTSQKRSERANDTDKFARSCTIISQIHLTKTNCHGLSALGRMLLPFNQGSRDIPLTPLHSESEEKLSSAESSARPNNGLCGWYPGAFWRRTILPRFSPRTRTPPSLFTPWRLRCAFCCSFHFSSFSQPTLRTTVVLCSCTSDGLFTIFRRPMWFIGRGHLYTIITEKKRTPI